MALNKAAPAFSFKKNGRGRTAFVTGADGRLGRNLVRALQRDGYEVRTLSLRKDFVNRIPGGVVPYIGDITNKKLLNDALHGVDVVFHLAAIVSEYKAHTEEIVRVNVEGTTNVLEACRQNGIGHVVFASTVDVYGNNRNDVLTEDSKLKPTDKYGYSKMLAEKEIEKYADRIDYTIFRMAAIYGNEFSASYFKVFKAIKEGKAYVIGSGNNSLSLIHIDDVVRAYLLADQKHNNSRSIYNLSDGRKYTLQEMFNMVADIMKVERPSRHISPIIVRLMAKNRNIDSDELRFLMSNRVIDIGKIRNELGFKPSIDIKEGALELVREFQKSKDA
ncbi:MAG: NAD(P)-dependent oxidoreductase [Candidatus Micrarchaeota archaeon]|nr:NAD(P)-dependent oxidoreductase [Candidatus Micrarchaeota archaeon]MDE1834895.1 NAD(P)-dependent oxidoreductase [Candidatus Micrarchaeota archaeon]MDE1858913.1 NAD(P)-dependent oxidoreductase [Candidatus Micrarchaeota archaeon]